METIIVENSNIITDSRIYELEEDLALYKMRNSKIRKELTAYKELVTVFLDNANNLLQSSEETIAKVFEYIHSKGWDNEYRSKNKK